MSITLGISTVCAQSAVYFCKSNGTYGFCYGTETPMDARVCAYNQCIDNGGVKPVLVTWTEAKGYGSICIGQGADGSVVIGCAMGFATQSEADASARAECERNGAKKMKVEQRWFDE